MSRLSLHWPENPLEFGLDIVVGIEYDTGQILRELSECFPNYNYLNVFIRIVSNSSIMREWYVSFVG